MQDPILWKENNAYFYLSCWTILWALALLFCRQQFARELLREGRVGTVMWHFPLQPGIFALLQESGLSKWLGSKLTPLQSIPHPAIAFLLCLLIATFTECTSNVATTTLFLPILASMVSASISKCSYKDSFQVLGCQNLSDKAKHWFLYPTQGGQDLKQKFMCTYRNTHRA